MMAQVALGLSLLGAADASAVYVASPDEPRYSGQIRRFEVFATATREGVPRVAVRFHHGQGSFAFLVEGPASRSLLSPRRTLDITRYVLVSSNGSALEFRDRLTEKPILPFSFTLQPDAFLPACFDEQGRLHKRASFLGESFTLQAEPAGKPPETDRALRIALGDDLLVGTSRNARDTNGRRITQAEFQQNPNLDYTYRPHDRQDLARMLAAGFNYFDRVLPEQLEYLFDKPVFFDLSGFTGHKRPVFPEIFFHPGFQGVEDFLDEPAYIFSEDFSPGPEMSLQEMARRQEKRTRDEYDRLARGRQTGLMPILKGAGVVLNGCELLEPQFPIWEEFHSTGCYQLRIPVSGFIHEGRYRHPETVNLLNSALRTRLPRRPETVFRFYFAFLRGAARVFNKDWGMSIYGQADPAVSLLGMTMAYDRGARWIYFWSSDRDHHLPFEEQLALARGLTEHVAAHARRSRQELNHAADDAIVLPYGFTFDVSDWQKARLPALWHRDAFPLETGKLEDGTPYYAVLRCAAEQMERLMADEREFDVVVDVPELKTAGYGNLHDVLPAARRARYDYFWSVNGRYYYLLAVLVAFLIVFRTYRIVRWCKRRKAAAQPTPQQP